MAQGWGRPSSAKARRSLCQTGGESRILPSRAGRGSAPAQGVGTDHPEWTGRRPGVRSEDLCREHPWGAVLSSPAGGPAWSSESGCAPAERGVHQLEEGPCPQWEEGSLPKLLAAPQTPRQALQVPGDLAEKQQSQRQLRVSREAKGYREKPDPAESETAPPQPTAPCEHLPLSCCFSRICFSERRGEYSRTIKYSFCGSCSIYMPMCIQQTSSEGLLWARGWWTSASATVG